MRIALDNEKEVPALKEIRAQTAGITLSVDLQENYRIAGKVAPLGGVRPALRVAAGCGLPVVVSSAVESSVGLAAGVALAAALPELDYDCGLATMSLLTGDVTGDPLVPAGGMLAVRAGEVDFERLAAWECDPAAWRERALAAAEFLA